MIGLAILGWGYLTGELATAMGLAVLAEGPLAIKWRWKIDHEQIARLWDTVLLVYLSTTVIMFFRLGPDGMLYSLIKWTPVIGFPLLLVQRLSASDTVALHTVSILGKYIRGVERGYYGRMERPERHINIEYPYLCLVALGAGMVRSDNSAFFIMISILLGWSLWTARKSYGLQSSIWIPAFVIAVSLGYAGQSGIHTLHRYFENRFYGLFSGNVMMAGPDENGFTSIGRVGRVKQSANIVWRLHVEKGTAPTYLKSATYATYVRGLWSNPHGRSDYNTAPTFRDDERRYWLLAGDSNRVYETQFRMLGRGVGTPEGLMQNEPSEQYAYLVLPDETGVLTDLEQGEVQINAIRTIRTLGAGEVTQFTVRSSPEISREPPPTRADLIIPESERPGILRTAKSLGLRQMNERDAVQAIDSFFQNEFSYSTYLTIREDVNPRSLTALSQFLGIIRTGHCEYFAAGTVLLLRSAGIPSRYVVGYSVSEYDSAKDQYLIRGLHGHAWAQAWLDGRWVSIDNTPAGWEEADRGILTWLQPLKDKMGSLSLTVALWQRSPEGERAMALLVWVGIPLIVFALFYRIMKGQSGMERVARSRNARLQQNLPGQDSEFYELEEQLAGLLGPRPAGTPVQTWYLQQKSRLPAGIAEPLPEIISLHYAYRFTGQVLESRQRRHLADLTRQCLTALSASREAPR